MGDGVSIKKSHMYIGLVVLIVAGFFFFGGSSTGNVVATEDGYQKVVIDMKNYRYSPSVINVKANVPVRIYLSNNVQGCFRDLTLPEMGINKYLRSSNDYVEVTFPKGTYTFACSMNMGSGKIIAE